MADNPFEIPQSLREVSEQNLNQAHAAYDQLMDFVVKTMDAWVAALPANPVTAGLKDIQGHALEIAKDNAKSAFTFAGKISTAQSLQEILTLQTQFIQDRMQSFVSQTQQLYSSIVEAFQKSERGGFGAGAFGTVPNITPSIPSAAGSAAMAGFKEVQERAIAIAKKNADSAFALAENIGKAQNLQDIFSIQTRFAQDQMQAYASETQEIQQLIGDAVKKLQGVRA